MPSRFITLFAIGIFIVLVAYTVYCIEKWKRKDKYETVKELVLECEICNNIDTYYDINVNDFTKVYPCPKLGCNGNLRKILKYIK